MNGEAETILGKHYALLVKFLFGEYETNGTTIQIHENVLQMPNQLTFSEFNKLTNLKDDKDSILAMIQQLNDGKDSKGAKYSRHAGIFTVLSGWIRNKTKTYDNN